ncbi:hypothetical protein ACFL0I_00410 [Gemmatimonadota bacterium]
MSFGVRSSESAQGNEQGRKIVKAVTAETIVALVILSGIFAVFTWKMGVAFTFKTAMGTAHDLILNTVLFLMGVIVLAGAFTSLISEFGIVSVANRILSPLMKPLFGLPGAASIGVVATYLSDNPAIMPLGTDKGFLKYFKKWQVPTLVNLGAVFGMGLIVTTFMLAQSSPAEPLGRAVLLGNIGAILGGVLSVRLMGIFGRRKYGKSEEVLTEGDEGYDLLRFREVRKGTVPERALQALLDGGTHGVKTGLDIMPGVVIVCTVVMMLAFGPGEGGYTGGAYEGIAFFPWVGERLSFIIEPLFGFSNPEAIAFPVTSLGSVGAAIAMVPQFLESGIIGAKGICVFTALGICNAGFLSVHVGMMDGLRERDLTSVAIATHFIGGLFAGVFGHALFLMFG